MRFVKVEQVDRILNDLRKDFFFRREIESVELIESVGRILAEDIYSNITLPKYNIATMDGYAVNSSDIPPLKIAGEIFPDTSPLRAERGFAYYITTGSPLPEGSDAVVKIEDAIISEEGLLNYDKVVPGKYVLLRGSDIRENELVIEAGRRITPQEVAMLSALNIQKVKVLKKYKVGVLATGNEIKKGIIRDVNSPMIMAFLKQWNEDYQYLGCCSDDYDELKERVTEALEFCDAIIISGGVSVGKKDYVIKLIENEGELILHKVKMRPGKPMTIGLVKNKLIFALPGKPAGSFISLLNLRKFFIGDIPFPIIKLPMKKDVKLPTPGFEYIIFIKNIDGYAYPLGYKDSPINIIPENSNYQPSLISNTVKTLLADGFILTSEDLKKDQTVEVNLFY